MALNSEDQREKLRPGRAFARPGPRQEAVVFLGQGSESFECGGRTGWAARAGLWPVAGLRARSGVCGRVVVCLVHVWCVWYGMHSRCTLHSSLSSSPPRACGGGKSRCGRGTKQAVCGCKRRSIWKYFNGGREPSSQFTVGLHRIASTRLGALWASDGPLDGSAMGRVVRSWFGPGSRACRDGGGIRLEMPDTKTGAPSPSCH